jgi:cytochrome c-type biogenesis protein CcmH/NrfG
MSELKTTTINYGTSTQAFALAAVSLVLGVCGGMLVRRATTRTVTPQVMTAPEQAPVASAPTPASFGSVAAMPSAQELKQAADQQATPLLEKLRTDPTNATLLTNLGNIYYDAKQYSTAIEYYERSLKARPADTSVRTDMGTAYWYNGDADTAIAQFQKALSYEPTKADTLFNLGVVEFQGKHDAKKAIATWQKLLDTNPGYENKERVRQLMAQAQNR